MARLSLGSRQLIIGVVVAVTVVATLVWMRRRMTQREGFFGAIARVVTAVAKGVAKEFTGPVKTLIGQGNNGNKAPAYQVTYSGRQWDGADWSCPWWSVETGATEDAKACITSQYHSPVWKWTGKEWGWACANGTVPTNDKVWEKKCEVGWTSRVQDGGAWKCPWGAEDSGKNWSNSTWEEAHKQCRRNRPYTLRINQGGKWVCPAGSTDTKRSWGDKNEWDQCKWTGP